MKPLPDRSPSKKNTVYIDEAIQTLEERLSRWTTNYNATDKGNMPMSGFNRVVLVGNLTRDPEIKQLPSGVSVGKFGLAINEYYKDRNQESKTRVCFVDVEVWRNQAESCAKYLRKGSPVLIEGRLQYESWKSAAGDTRNRIKVTADRVQFLHAKATTDAPAPSQQAPEEAVMEGDVI